MRIGFSGHRPNRLKIGAAQLSELLREVLSAIAGGARASDPDAPVVALSALAEGADRVFAEVALSLGYSLHALLPFPSADYETTFADPTTTASYRRLLGGAATLIELPGTLALSTAAYEAVGRATVDACELFLTVWDGEAAAGRGGTTEIIAYALANRRPTLWIDASRPRAPMRLLGVEPLPDAKALQAADIAAIASAISALQLSGQRPG